MLAYENIEYLWAQLMHTAGPNRSVLLEMSCYSLKDPMAVTKTHQSPSMRLLIRATTVVDIDGERGCLANVARAVMAVRAGNIGIQSQIRLAELYPCYPPFHFVFGSAHCGQVDRPGLLQRMRWGEQFSVAETAA